MDSIIEGFPTLALYKHSGNPKYSGIKDTHQLLTLNVASTRNELVRRKTATSGLSSWRTSMAASAINYFSYRLIQERLPASQPWHLHIGTPYSMGTQGSTLSVWRIPGSRHIHTQVSVNGVPQYLNLPPEEYLYMVLLSSDSWTTRLPLQELLPNIVYRPGRQHCPTQRGI